ncbi:MAG: ATP-binding cassette domain-containing protein [Rikenellaceae bacterium]|nr:ATP-binding cassette domain-containing protein [Rikenellaceae bacterium]
MRGIKVKINGAVPLSSAFRFRSPVDWTIREGENWAVAGRNGAGKSTLADILMRRIPLREGSVDLYTRGGRPSYEAVRSIGFRDIYSIVDCREAYYQQRWNADGREATPLAGTLFSEMQRKAAEPLFERFSLSGALEKRIVSLSSGELRKLLVIRALANRPEILIVDNPFVGLDERSRRELSVMLGQIAGGGKLQFILLVSDPRDVPDWIDRVLPVSGMSVGEPLSIAEFSSKAGRLFPLLEITEVPEYIPEPDKPFEVFAELENVTVRYGERTILDGVDWKVRRGDKWALLGGNGSGKSTLLSLLYGDNPQAYANRVSLFDRRRGTGESIWEIKKRIGFLNSDIHSFYMKEIPAEEVVMSGFYDTVGLYSAQGPARRIEAEKWLTAFGGAHLSGRTFTKLSFGEQRVVMLARTLVKRPPVVILDEPMHGLDSSWGRLAGRVIEKYCSCPEVTLIYVTHYSGEIPPCVKDIKRL